MRRIGLVGVGAAVAVLLAGCTGAGRPVAAPTTTVTVRASAAPRTVQASASPTPSPTPSTSPSSPSATGAPAASSSGCPATGGSLPADATVRAIDDVDGDGKGDEEFYDRATTSGVPRVGIRTASGALISVDDRMAGGGDHGAWAAGLESDPSVLVVDDGHDAELFYLVHCRWVQAVNPQGKQYVFALYGFGQYGTGVGCIGSARGGRELAGFDAVKTSGGRYRIDTTPVVTKDGRTATNGAKVTGTTTFADSSSQVQDARRSLCTGVPRITSVGR